MLKATKTLPQAALRHGPGRFRSLLTFDAPNVGDAVLRAATLLKELEAPELVDKPLKVLVGLGCRLLDGHRDFGALSAELGTRPVFDATQPSILVQIAAETEDERTYALRLVKRVFGADIRLLHEFHAGRHALSREPFGYRDGLAMEDVEVPISPSVAGVSWLLFQNCKQDVAAFYATLATEREQDEVMGRERDPKPDSTFVAPKSSHLAVARKANTVDGKSRLLRRAFSYGSYGEEGMVFLASAAHPDHLKHALERFMKADALGRHTQLGATGIYVVPPSAAWLSQHATLHALGANRPGPEQPFYPAHPLVLYDMTPSSRDFFVKVFHQHHENFDERGDLRRDIQLLSKGLAKLLYGGRIRSGSVLFQLLERVFVSDTCAKAVAGLEGDAKLQRDLESLAKHREDFERAKRTIEQTRAQRGDTAVDQELNGLERRFDLKVEDLRARVREKILANDAVEKVLSEPALAQRSIGELVLECILQDAETMHAQTAAAKDELDHIIELCRLAAKDARELNAAAGKYMTFTC
jgi:hypothetical protein